MRDQVDEVVGAFGGRLGLRERERRVSGEWAAVWLTAALIRRCRVSRWPRARSRGRRDRSPRGGRSPLPAGAGAGGAQCRADRLQRLTDAPRFGIAAGRQRHVEHRLRLFGGTREERRTGQAGIAVHTRETARERDRVLRVAGRGRGQAVAVEQRGHRAAQHGSRRRPRRGLPTARRAAPVERGSGQAVGGVRGEHDPLGGHAREQLDHVEREEAGDVVEHARVAGQA